MKMLRTLLAAFLVLTLGIAAPAQAGDNARRIEVTGEATTLNPTQGDPCFAGGNGFVSQTQYVGVVEPLGKLDPTGSTAEYCTVPSSRASPRSWRRGIGSSSPGVASWP